ncbi:MAG: hypothetical protein HKL80_06785 [Acidimicrobiales bacterium]|nr:hypothetical protein [Acidimicrobiales bacterium]
MKRENVLFRSCVAIALTIAGVLVVLTLVINTSHAAKVLNSASFATSTVTTSILATTKSPTCGAWGEPGSGTSKTIVDQLSANVYSYYECWFDGQSWWIGFQSKVGSNPAIATFRCSPGDSACLSSSANPSLSGWHLYPAPFSGVMSLIGSTYPGMLILDVGGHQLIFDTTNGIWYQNPPNNWSECINLWAKVDPVSPTQASGTVQANFLANNPICA